MPVLGPGVIIVKFRADVATHMAGFFDGMRRQWVDSMRIHELEIESILLFEREWARGELDIDEVDYKPIFDEFGGRDRGDVFIPSRADPSHGGASQLLSDSLKEMVHRFVSFEEGEIGNFFPEIVKIVVRERRR